jgi:hypothetical protein
MKKSIKRKMGKCTCFNCGCEFEKPVSEIKRNEKFGRHNFCSRTCVGHFNTERIKLIKTTYDISKHSNNGRDEYTGFREFLRRVKSRNYENNLDLDYLKELWEKQNICVYTGVKLVLPKRKGWNNQLFCASIDRIDSNLGYVKGNIQYISIAANHAKNNMSHEEMITLCQLIYEHKKTLPESKV